MKAMVLAAGIGSRLRPYTETVPKPLFPVLGVPLIEWVIRALTIAGIRRIVVNLHHQPAKIVRFLGNGKALGVEITYSDEPIILGTGGGLWAVREFFRGEEAFFVHNGDVWHEAHLEDMLSVHRALGADATMMLVKDTMQPEAHVVGVRGDHVVGIRGKPQSAYEERYVFAGVSVLTQEIFRHLPEGAVSCLVRHGLISMLEAGKKVCAAKMDKRFCDIGTVERYLGLQHALLAEGPQRAFELRGLEGPKPLAEGVYGFEPVEVDPGAVLWPPVLLCKSVRVERGACVGPNVVLCEAAAVASGAKVKNAVVFPRVQVAGDRSGILLS